MDDMDKLMLLTGKSQLRKILAINMTTERFGLSLSEDDVSILLKAHRDTLKDQRRIEFGEGILPKLIFTFCDSPYIDQSNYVDTIARLQDIFYLYKNESMDLLTDDELLEFMKKAFDGVCEGSLDYLEETSLESYARELRADSQSFFEHYKITGRERDDE